MIKLLFIAIICACVHGNIGASERAALEAIMHQIKVNTYASDGSGSEGSVDLDSIDDCVVGEMTSGDHYYLFQCGEGELVVIILIDTMEVRGLFVLFFLKPLCNLWRI